MNPIKKSRLKKMLWSLPIVFTLLLVWDFSSLGVRFEQLTRDLRFQYIERENKFSDQVIFIDIDEISMKNLSLQYGRWPWPRRIYKDMLEFIAMGEPNTVLFDILFTEPQLDSNDDQQLGQASAQLSTSHAIQLLPEPSEEGLSIRKLTIDRNYLLNITPPPNSSDFRDYLLPNKNLLSLSPHLHVTNINKDSDGVIRRVPLWHNYNGNILPSLTMMALLKKGHDKNQRLIRKTLKTSKTEIPLDDNHQFIVNYYNKDDGPETHSLSALIGSAQQILSGEVEDPAQLKVNPFSFADKIIIIGGSANGLMDIKATPVSNKYPGPLVHATAISNILSGHFLKFSNPTWSWLISFLIIIAIYSSILLSSRPLVQYLTPLILISCYFGYSAVAFKIQDFVIPIATPLLFFVISFLDAFVYLSFVEAKEKRKISGTLSKYLSPSVAKDLVEKGINPTAEIGSKKNLSILFSDIRGFTTLSENHPPEQVVKTLNEYLGNMTEIIFQHDGTLDKFIGDAVMAFWGAPISDEQHAVHAVKAAIDMQLELANLNRNWSAENRENLAIGIGINTGDVIVGNIGSEKRLDYTVIGDHVNLASRVEGLTKQYGVPLLITDSTYEMLGDQFLCRPIDWVQVKGKTQPVQILQPLCYNSESVSNFHENKELCQQFSIALDHYREGQFDTALKALNSILEKHLDDGPARVLRQRCMNLIISPPSDWDGVYMAKSK